MAHIKLNMEIHRLEGFSEEAFITKLSRNLQEVGVTKLQYDAKDDQFVFYVEYQVLSSQFSYGPILGCFSSIEQEYPSIKIISINPLQLRNVFFERRKI